MSHVNDFFARLTIARAFALAFVAIGALHASALQDPPYWDALMGAFCQGHWLATHSFSPFALMSESANFTKGGACVYPFSVYPWIVGSCERAGLAQNTTFVLLHLLSFVAAASIVASTFVLVRRAAGGGIAALVALALAAQPMFRSLSCQMNMDVLLAACTLLAIVALADKRFVAAAVWAAIALLVKPNAIILVGSSTASIGLRWLKPMWFDLDERERRRARLALVLHLGLCALFVVEFVLIARFGQSPPGVSLFGGTLQFLAKRLWTLPEFGLALLAVGALVPWFARRALKQKATCLEIDTVVFTIVFVAFYCQYENVLPRYFIQAWPIVMTVLVIAALEWRIPRRVVGAACVLFAAFGLVNAHGRFHPTKLADWSVPGDSRPLVSNEGWLFERSLEYRDDMALDLAIAQRCEARQTEVVVANWPLLQLLAVPELGYVHTPPTLATAELPLEFAAQPVRRASELPAETAVLWAVTPNVYNSPNTRVLPGDVIVETFERGRLRAFLLSRPRASPPDRR